MTRFILSCGPFGILLTVLSAAVLFFAVKTLSARQYGGTLILLGVTCAATGFLSQTTAIYSSLTAILPAEELDPSMVGAGLRESFNSTWWGTGLLALSLLVWIIAAAKNRKRSTI